MLKDYIFIARIDHWFKNVFIFPGVAVALVLTSTAISWTVFFNIILAFVSCCFVASANYVINEYLDSKFDKFHPSKKFRPGASGHLQKKYVLLEYVLFIILGLSISQMISSEHVLASISLLVMGVLYNVEPFRTKDRVYLDVASESVNNPIRFVLGWFAVSCVTFPPSSILLAYWAGGGFLMAVKRYAEYRFINNPELAGNYRRSFKFYTEQKLLLYSIFCALTASLFLGVFLIKYRAEFILSFPFFAILFVWYLNLGMRPLSPTQSPEKLYQERPFMAYVLFLTALVTALLFIDIPMLKNISTPIF